MDLLEIVASVDGDWEKLPPKVMAQFGSDNLEHCYYCAQQGNVVPAVDEVNAIVTGYSLNKDRRISSWDDIQAHANESDTIERKAYFLYARAYDSVLRGVCRDHIKVCEWCDDNYCGTLPQDSLWNRGLNTRFNDTSWVLNHNPSGGCEGWSWDSTLCLGCAENASACARCSGLINRDYDNWNDVSGDTWCESCTDDDAVWCEPCDQYHTEPCGDEDWNYGGGRVHDYSYKPDPIFGHLPSDLYDYHTPEGTAINFRTKGVPFMGFELEVESGHSDINEGIDVIEAHLGGDETYVYLKGDGSLDHGFEIVSHPATLASHKTRNLPQALKALSDLGFRSWRTHTCGIHVHVARAGFSNPSHVWKFTHFIVDNKDAMIKLAGRNSDRWASFNLESYGNGGIKNRAKGSQYYNRYEAINFGNARTLELRFFKGSLKVERLYSALELTEGAVEYTRNLSVQDVINGGLDFAQFVKWLRERADKYPNLLSYVDTLGIAEYTRSGDRKPVFAQADDFQVDDIY